MTNIELFYFTGKCLTIEEHPGFRKEIIDTITTDSFDWEKFIELCSNNLILPVIYLKFKSHEILEYLPEEVSEFLKEIYDLNQERNNQILNQLREVTNILNENNIFPLYLKGAGHLLDGLYADIGERMIGDIDMLVPEKDYIIAANLIIQKLGYSADIPEYFDVSKMKHFPRLYKIGQAADVEIHRLLITNQSNSCLNPDNVFKEKKAAMELNGCYVLSHKHSVILNFIHGQLEHMGQLFGIIPLRDLYDLYLLSQMYEVSLTLKEIRQRNKAIAYYVFAGYVLGLPGKLYSEENYQSRILRRKHQLNMDSKIFYYTYRTIVYFSQRILVGYIVQFFQSIYSKKIRKSVFRRITNKKWYAAHIHSFSEHFKNNQKKSSEI